MFSESSLGDRVQINGGVNFRGDIVEGARNFVRLDRSLGTTYAFDFLKETGLRRWRNAGHHNGITIAGPRGYRIFKVLLLGETHVRTD